MLALKLDMIGIALCNSGPVMTVYGGTSRVLGTNPISIAVPADQEYPLVFDAATSQAAFNRIIVANREEREIPSGWAVDQHGQPTVNAGEALLGAVIPFGGYKGSGLAVMVKVLSGLLSGAFLAAAGGEQPAAKHTGVGFFFGGVHITDFVDTALFKQAVDELIASLKASRREDNYGEIYMPGEKEYISRANSIKQGVDISGAVLADLQEVQKRYGLKSILEIITVSE